VFLLKVKESFLKDIIINQNNQQVQDIWEEITFVCENSTSAEIKANALLQYITSVKYDDGSGEEHQRPSSSIGVNSYGSTSS